MIRDKLTGSAVSEHAGPEKILYIVSLIKDVEIRYSQIKFIFAILQAFFRSRN